MVSGVVEKAEAGTDLPGCVSLGKQAVLLLKNPGFFIRGKKKWQEYGYKKINGSYYWDCFLNVLPTKAFHQKRNPLDSVS